MATRPKAVIESRNGEKFSPITIAKNVLTDDGQNLHDILSDRKEDMMTPTIENSSSMSKIGQGDNVDYSSNVVNGAYESMVLKGKSMVNCIQESSSQDVVLPYEFTEGQSVTISDTKEGGALGVELKGQTLVNLVPRKIIDHIASSDWDGYCCLVQNSKQSFDEWRTLQDLKSNTKYYISCYVETFEDANNKDYCLNNPSVESIFEDSMTVNGVGRYQWLSTTKSELTDEIFIALRSQNANARGAIKIRDIMIIEYREGMENWDIPYFEGMQSVKMPTLHTVGKNLLNNVAVTDGWVNITSIFKKNTTYILSADINNQSNVNARTRLNIYNSDGTMSYYGEVAPSGYSGRLSTKICHTKDFYKAELLTRQYFHSSPEGVCDIANYQLELATSPTPYEPHKSSILSLPEEVVLRSLPNGVCDTFNTRTGVYTQRIGEVILNGDASESWLNFKNSDEKTVRCQLVKRDSARCTNTEINIACDKLRVVENRKWQNDDEQIERGHGDDYISIRILKSKLSSETLEGFKIYLQTNPITVQYELATPIIAKINLPSTLKSWNTTTHIYSEIPENSLYPILSHSNPTYPVIIKPSTKYSIVANSYSNSHTNSTINFNLGGATASTTVGNRVTTITTPSTLSNELLTMSGRGNKLNNVMVIEGDVVGDEPYFEGMCDSKSPILLNCGENLFDEQRHSNPDNFFVHSAYWSIPIQLKGNTEYKFSYTFNNVFDKQVVMRFATCPWTATAHSTHPYSLGQVFNKNITSNLMGRTESMLFTTPADGLVYLHYYNTELTNSPSSFNLASWYTYILKDIHLEESSTPTQYKPYKSNTTTFNQKDDKTIVLRSLPNGVCDTLNVETGEYVQRIGDYTVNGTETSWFTYIDTTGASNNYLNQTSCAFGVHLTGKVKGNGVLCDKLPTRYIGWWVDRNTGEGICGIDNDNRIFLRVKNEKTGVLYTDNASTALEKVKTYLASNPVTVQYELATPIVKQVNVEGYPYAYENGHILLESGSQEQSLTPTIEYSIVANRGGQIRSNQRMVERHQKQLDRLQAMILTNLVNTQYEQTLTNLKYDLKNVREEVK